MKLINNKTLTFIAMSIPLFFILIPYGNAASVRKVSMDEMLQQCQFVFEGNVIALESKENEQKRIHTYATFEIIDVIKGDYFGETITLSFLGGTVGEVTMAVSAMKLPELGEHGIYFVESLERSQVHPLYGWSQGHFLVKDNDTGTNLVMTNNKQPVIEMVNGQINPNQDSVQALSNGVARGLSLAQEKNDVRGLTANEFKKALRERLGVLSEKN